MLVFKRYDHIILSVLIEPFLSNLTIFLANFETLLITFGASTQADTQIILFAHIVKIHIVLMLFHSWRHDHELWLSAIHRNSFNFNLRRMVSVSDRDYCYRPLIT